MKFTTQEHVEPLTPHRKGLLRRVHDAAAMVGLEGDGYRLGLLALTGSKTAVALSNAQIVQAIRDFESMLVQDNSAEALAHLLY